MTSAADLPRPVSEQLAQHKRWMPARDRLWFTGAPKPVRQPAAIVVRFQPASWPAYCPPVRYDSCDPDWLQRSWKAIAREVSDKHQIERSEIFSHRRDRPLVLARHEFFYRCHTETTLSFSAIGRLSGFDHATVMGGVKKHKRRMEAAE